MIDKKINKLRNLIKLNNIDGYIVPKNDEFFSEYAFPNRLKTISNFSGSAGLAIILKDKNFLFVDGRYTLQSKIESGNTASWSIYQTVHEYLGAFEEIKDPYLSEKGSDLKDVGYRLLHYLGHEVLYVTKKTGILIMRQLLPGDIARMDTTRIKGIILSTGGIVSHAAILARSLGIPAVCLEDRELELIKDGDPLVIDGDSGLAVAYPEKEVLAEFKQLLVEQQQDRKSVV